MTQSEVPNSIGRFHILKTLGKGAQGTVYLAKDPHLQRRVAIKTLLLGSASNRDKEIKVLLDEARIVSQMQHPNIATLYDAGEEKGEPYLVFEYVEGMTLAQLIKLKGAMSSVKAVDLTMQILEGISYAHQKHVVHRDLKPANIMIDANEVPRIMDFGIARNLSVDKADEGGFEGTPLYMAPEYISIGATSPSSDIFSVGVMLYEMLIGRNPIQGSSLNEVLDKIVNQSIKPPSHANSEVDERLDSIVLKALAKDPKDRYANAESMFKALENYLKPSDEDAAHSSSEGAQSTVEFLLRRMRHKSDFPALSQAISAINKISADENESVAALSNVILKDFSLTNKLLKLVNAAYYGQFGGSISTVSRAVVILGFDAVRNVAITLILLENLQNKPQAAKLKDEIIATFFSGVIAKGIAAQGHVRDVEEAFVCAMFHNLGKLLATFYFHEESVEINKLLEKGDTTERKAAVSVLGVTYEDLGIGIAKAWSFPEKMIASMREITEDKVRKPQTDIEKFRVLSGLSNELCKVASSTPLEEKGKRLKMMAARYGDSMSMTEKQLSSAIDNSMREFLREASIFEIDARNSTLMKKISQWSGIPVNVKPQDEKSAEAAGDNTVLMDTALKETVLMTAGPSEQVAGASKEDRREAAQEILAAGIQDITNTLVDDYKLNDLLRMILETMYRGMNFSRVLLCIKDAKQNSMNGRFGFGDDIDDVLKIFKFSLKYTPDVFHVSLDQGLDILIADVDAENIKSRIPDWYRSNIGAQSFILLPIRIDKTAVGLLYADMTTGELVIQPKELSMLKTLRNQAVLAIKQKL